MEKEDCRSDDVASSGRCLREKKEKAGWLMARPHFPVSSLLSPFVVVLVTGTVVVERGCLAGRLSTDIKEVLICPTRPASRHYVIMGRNEKEAALIPCNTLASSFLL